MGSPHVSEKRVLIFSLVVSMIHGILRTSTLDSMGCPHVSKRAVLILTSLLSASVKYICSYARMKICMFDACISVCMDECMYVCIYVRLYR